MPLDQDDLKVKAQWDEIQKLEKEIKQIHQAINQQSAVYEQHFKIANDKIKEAKTVQQKFLQLDRVFYKALIDKEALNKEVAKFNLLINIVDESLASNSDVELTLMSSNEANAVSELAGYGDFD